MHSHPSVDPAPSLISIAVADDPLLGSTLQNRYRVVERLGGGGMGVVYRGERVGLGRAVAIKFLGDRAIAYDGARRRFETEARAASQLHHPGCVPVIDIGQESGSPYIVMELVDGACLRQVMERGPISVPRALAIATQVLDALAHAHDRGIVHRDIKPENILISVEPVVDPAGDDRVRPIIRRERAHLTDFGLARFAAAPTSSHDLAIGTPGYMSPEQTLGLTADTRSDLYNVGVLLFEMLTGELPFDGGNAFMTLELHRSAPVPYFDDLAPDRAIPSAIEGVVRRAMSKRPDQRYASAHDFSAALHRAAAVAHSDSDDAALDELLSERPWWSCDPRWFGALAVVALLAWAIA